MRWRAAATRSSAMPSSPCSKHRAASATRPGWTPLPILVERDGRDRRRRAGLSQDPQPGRICLRPWLGRGVGARGQAYYPKLQVAVPFTPGAGAAPARRPRRAARRAGGGDGAERPVVGPHHLLRRGRRGRGRGARLAAPRRASNITGSTAAMPASTTSSPRCRAASARRSARNAPRRARGSTSSRCAAPRSSPRTWRRDVALLPGHRQPQMGPALSDRAPASTGSARRWATRSCCSSRCATAGRSPARSTSSAANALYGRYWGAAEEVPFLHFELSYYRAIDWAIAHGLDVGPGRRAGRA